jgi:UDPglucose--hexose-1-phosphate uridylyltransferase
MGAFIFDDLTGTPTILATNRAKRDDQTGAVSGKTVDKGDVKVCYFCKGNEHLTPPALYQDADDWNVRVFTNKFPVVPEHEIIVHSPSHEKDIEDLSHDQNVRFVRALLNRVHNYTSQEKEVLLFNNRGGKAGASITHPHTQLIALKGFPGIIELEKSKALQYYNEHNSCYWCDMVKEVAADKKRVVYESKHFVLFVPEASRWSYEMILVPKEHKPNIEFVNEMEINDLAQMLKATLSAYNILFQRPDRNYWIHTQRYDPYHWHMGFIAHIKVLGGLELGAGIWVSDKASPEDAAAKLGVHVKACYEGETASIAL